MAKCAVELVQLPRSRRIGRGDERRRHLIDVDSRVFAHVAPYIINVLIMHYREEPSADIGALLPEMSLGDAAQKRVLHEIVRPIAVARERPRVATARERPRIATQSRDLLFDEAVKFGHPR